MCITVYNTVKERETIGTENEQGFCTCLRFYFPPAGLQPISPAAAAFILTIPQRPGVTF